MSLQPGTRLGDFEVHSLLGAGGMGEVYRAEDVRLGRQVALKLLHSEVSADPERLARFEREARLLAALSHPNVATLLGFESAGDDVFLVMELVEGETLGERLAAGPLPLTEAVEIFTQIADGLEAAHERGIVHRDLKPANVKIDAGDRVKLLDFGLAKALLTDGSSGSSELSSSPTRAYGATQRGEILGTAPYMSPEQARGRGVDRRTDIWAFGCCLFEALAGIGPFEAESVTDALANVLREEPDWQLLPSPPERLKRLLVRCLDKDPRRRLSWIGEARFELGQALEDRDEGPSPTPGPSAATEPRRLSLRLDAPLEPASTAASSIPERQQTPVALSPDGRWLVWVAEGGRRRQLYKRRLDRLDAEPIPGTDDPNCPFFSPDSQSLAWFERGKSRLRRMSIQGGPATTVALVEQSHGACWGDDGWIYFTSFHPGGLRRVRDSGGAHERIEIEGLDPWGFVGYPQLLPDARHLLVRIKRDLMVVPVAGGQPQPLLRQVGLARLLGSGDLVYSQQGRLLAQRFDSRRKALTGPVVPIDETGLGDGSREPLEWSCAADGTLVYAPVTRSRGAARGLVWIDRQGNREPLDLPGPWEWDWARLSPDGGRMVTGCGASSGQYDVWLHDLERGTSTRLTLHPAANYLPVWSPDGKRVVFVSGREGGVGNLFWKAADGSDRSERLTESELPQMPFCFTPDGRSLLFGERLHPRRSTSLWRLDLEGDRTPSLLLDTRSMDRCAALSPDGRWLAYSSDESGREEVYVRPWPDLGQRWQISANGGMQPLWNPRGGELFYLEDDRMMSVTVESEPDFRPSAPQVLFEGLEHSIFPSFDVAPDGERFLVPVWHDDAGAPINELVVVLNWMQELARHTRP